MIEKIMTRLGFQAVRYRTNWPSGDEHLDNDLHEPSPTNTVAAKRVRIQQSISAKESLLPSRQHALSADFSRSCHPDCYLCS
jgi:hypothetical protein